MSSSPSLHTDTMPAPLLHSCPPVSSHAADTDAIDATATAAAAAASNIENVKLHHFDVNDPSIWIYQAESIFRVGVKL
jgi:hypothetical protein